MLALWYCWYNSLPEAPDAQDYASGCGRFRSESWTLERLLIESAELAAWETPMTLDAAKFRDALAKLGPEQPLFIDPPADFRAWLGEKRLPDDVVAFLLDTAIGNTVPFPDGSGGMCPTCDIKCLNEQESDILAAGLLGVGFSINGDFIVIDLRDDARQAGFVSHDDLWEESAKDAREFFAPVFDSLDGMVARMSVCLRGGADYPCDYYSALSWRKESNCLPSTQG
jgi:hypothetical protein